MSKTITDKRIQKRRSEAEMRTALSELINNQHTLHIPPQIDDADTIINDVISELIDARRIIESVRAFTLSFNAKLPKR